MADNFPANTTTTLFLPVDGYSLGNIDSAGDHDWFRVTLTAGIFYRFEENGQASGVRSGIFSIPALNGLPDPLLTLRDAAGNFITSNDDIFRFAGNYDSRITYTPLVSGTYYLDAGASLDAGTGTYIVRAIMTDDEPTSTPNTSRTLPVDIPPGNLNVPIEILRHWKYLFQCYAPLFRRYFYCGQSS